MKAKIRPLNVEKLRRNCDPDLFSFKTTEELPPLKEFLGQTRALRAAHFGLNIEREGFNIYALGPIGIGKRSIFLSILEKEAAKKTTPPDICYVHNFKEPRHPKLLLLEPGLGKILKEDMRSLIEILKISIQALLESEAYREKIKEIQQENQNKQQKAFQTLQKKAEEYGLTLIRTNQGLAVGVTKNGKILLENEFDELPEKEKEEKEQLMTEVHDKIAIFLDDLAIWHKEERQKIKETIKHFTIMEVGSAIDDVKKKYEKNEEISCYLCEVQKAIIENPSDFQKEEPVSSRLPWGNMKPSFIPYEVNVLVDNSELKGAPVIYEDNPIFNNLVGHIDQISQFGALVTDFTLLRAGALQKANGGYLLVDALKLLSEPYAWQALKRSLIAKKAGIENIGQMMGFIASVSLKPDPLPLNIKVILLGERYYYYLLCALDPEFPELFKVAADFDENIDRNKDNQLLFAKLLKKLADNNQLLPLTNKAVAEMVEYASRLVSDTTKMSTEVSYLTDILREADHWAQNEKSPIIDNVHIEKAIDEQKYRVSRVKDELYENIIRGVLRIEISGSKIGQINGLSYVKIGTSTFGQPNCISAQVHKGKGEVIDIERIVKLGGPIHSKGVLILSGYIAGYYAPEQTLHLAASLVFEQSYGVVDGDSASLAEACALLSAIARIPLKQGIAVTGSINQHGQVQAVGGINEKIEGFFDVCQKLGLTGEQGVIIPLANVDRLMLRKDVIKACQEGQFQIFAVDHADQAMEILTGKSAGARNKKGQFPKPSINALVEKRLKEFAKKSNKN